MDHLTTVLWVSEHGFIDIFFVSKALDENFPQARDKETKAFREVASSRPPR